MVREKKFLFLSDIEKRRNKQKKEKRFENSFRIFLIKVKKVFISETYKVEYFFLCYEKGILNLTKLYILSGWK